MPINPANLRWYLSGGSGNSDPKLSLGGARSNTTVTPSTLWDLVTGDESKVGDTEYRCIFLRNEDSNADGLIDPRLWLSQLTPAQDEVDIALTTNGKNQAAEGPVANEDTAPTGPTFSRPTSKATGLSLPTLFQNEFIAIWIRRVVPAACPAYNNNSFILSVEGDSTA